MSEIYCRYLQCIQVRPLDISSRDMLQAPAVHAPRVVYAHSGILPVESLWGLNSLCYMLQAPAVHPLRVACAHSRILPVESLWGLDHAQDVLKAPAIYPPHVALAHTLRLLSI